ncbi:hypothetical protein ACJX0J_036571, partial [Zea mays]
MEQGTWQTLVIHYQIIHQGERIHFIVFHVFPLALNDWQVNLRTLGALKCLYPLRDAEDAISDLDGMLAVNPVIVWGVNGWRSTIMAKTQKVLVTAFWCILTNEMRYRRAVYRIKQTYIISNQIPTNQIKKKQWDPYQSCYIYRKKKRLYPWDARKPSAQHL